MHKYQYDYSADSAAGHLVGLLTTHAAAGVVVDLGCGTAPLAAPLLDAGFEYVGYDIDAAVVASLVERGVDARLCDLAVDDPADLVDDALEGRRLAAVTAIDVVEHVPGFDRLLAALARVLDHHTAVLGVSIPNVAHEDLAAKLLAGRWDVTDIGLLDATHLNLFDERRLDRAMATAGLRELGRDDVDLVRTEQGLLHQHPYVYAHTSVGEWLRRLRSMSGPHSTTYQFVRVYRAQPAGEPFDGTPPAAPLADPSFTVVVLPVDGVEPDATIAAVHAQRFPATHVVVAPQGVSPAQLVADLKAEATSHVCFVAAGTVVDPGWLERFECTLRDHPARVGRAAVASAFPGGSTGWGLWRSMTLGDEPLHAFAVPLAPSAWLQLTDVDGPEAIWVWLLRTASMVGLVDVPGPSPLAAMPPRDTSALLTALGGDALLLPVGWHHELAAVRLSLNAERAEHSAALRAEQARADDLERHVRLLEGSFWWRVTGPGRRLADWSRGRRKA